MARRQTPFFSVIVPSYNRIDEIKELLQSLAGQRAGRDDYEVIVVDDGSTDGTAEWLRAFQAQTPMNLVLLSQDHRGPGAARNLGMKRAAGELLVFIDSDCLAPADWLENIDRAFAADSQLQAFGGRDDAHEDFPPILKAINYSMTSFISTGGMRGGKKKRLAKFVPRSFNMGLKKALFETIGGFGSLRHGQDIEFSNRIIKSGAKVAYLRDAVVYHKRRTSLRRFFKQVFNWGVARINLCRIDPDMLEPLHFLPAMGFWFAVSFSCAALIWPPVADMWRIAALLGAVALAASAVHAALRWRSIRTGLWVPLVMMAQICGYGLGFTLAYIWRVILRKPEFTGFVRKYYQ